MEAWRKPWPEQDPRTKKWHLRWRERGSDGQLHKKSIRCADHKDAIKRRDAKEDELRKVLGSTNSPHAELDGFLQRYILECVQVKRLREGSIRIKKDALGRYAGATKTLGAITRDSLVKYRDDLLSGLSGATVGIHMREVKAFVRWLWRETILTFNPWVNIQLPRNEPTPRFLTDSELVAIEKVATGQFRAIFRMAYLTGMRQTEILKARWEDIHWGKNHRAYLTILSTTAKNRRSRTIILRKEVIALLGSRGKGRLFEEWDKSSLRWAWDCAKAKAALTGRVRFHDLRHTFCRLYLQGGGTIADLMAITGHQSLAMMQVYAHFETRWKAERMDAMNLPTELSTGQLTGQIQDSVEGLSVIEGNVQADEDTLEGPIDLDNDAKNKGENKGVPPSDTEGFSGLQGTRPT